MLISEKMPVQYKQKPRDTWMRDPLLKDWLTIDKNDDTKCYCTYCKSSIVAKLCDLQAHAKTGKHKIASNCFKQQNKIMFPVASQKTQQQEAVLCLYVAKHSAIKPIDHLSDLCSSKFVDGNKIQVHRTKCTSIIKNVLGPCFLEQFKEDIGDAKFSLMLDESTDINVCLLNILI